MGTTSILDGGYEPTNITGGHHRMEFSRRNATERHGKTGRKWGDNCEKMFEWWIFF
jgi:hypothetical protein